MRAAINDFFEIITFKDNENLLKEVALLRHEVFCDEKGQFGNINCSACINSEIVETDQYEQQSLHSLVLYKPAKKFIGSVRLIFTDQNKQNLLPIELLLQQQMNLSIDGSSVSFRKHIAEISGITILPEFRPKLAVLELLRAVIKMSLENQITDVYTALEACVRRALIRAGIKLHPIGKIVDYNGLRQCYHENIQNFIDDVYHNNPAVWEIISDNGQLIPDFKHTNWSHKDHDDKYYSYL